MLKEIAIIALSAAPLAGALPWEAPWKHTPPAHTNPPNWNLNFSHKRPSHNRLAKRVETCPKIGDQPGLTNREWTLTFDEDWSEGFSKHWVPQLGHHYDHPDAPMNWGTWEVEEMTADPRNVFIDEDRNLQIVPVRDPYSKTWTSARIETKSDTFWKAEDKGLMAIEARILLPDIDPKNALGLWPAFWTMGRKFRDDGPKAWPAAGEVDIMENVNGDTKTHFTVHCGVAPGGPCNEFTGNTGPSIGTLARGVYHTWTLLIDRTADSWQEETMSWYIDGVQQRVLKGSGINDEAAWDAVAHQGLFIILNVAVGGAFPNAVNPNGAGKETPTDDTASGVGMGVGFVKVWHSNPQVPLVTKVKEVVSSAVSDVKDKMSSVLP